MAIFGKELAWVTHGPGPATTETVNVLPILLSGTGVIVSVKRTGRAG